MGGPDPEETPRRELIAGTCLGRSQDPAKQRWHRPYAQPCEGGDTALGSCLLLQSGRHCLSCLCSTQCETVTRAQPRANSSL